MKKRTIFILVIVMGALSYSWRSYIQPFLATFTESALELRPRENRKLVSDFSLLDLDGNTVRLSDYRGSAVFIGFWTTW